MPVQYIHMFVNFTPNQNSKILVVLRAKTEYLLFTYISRCISILYMYIKLNLS